MLWEETAGDGEFVVPRDIIDLCFRIECRELPVDHAWALYQGLRRLLPWIDGDARVAIHSVHGATSGNGWIRPPEVPGSLLQLPRRTRLYLRIPAEREPDALALCGCELRLDDYRMKLGDCHPKALVPSDTVFSRSLTGDYVDDEEAFTRWVADTLLERGIRLRKMLCGLRHVIHRPGDDIAARSVMLSDLEPMESIRLQESGIGSGRKLGCGIFLPHKSIAAVGQAQGEA